MSVAIVEKLLWKIVFRIFAKFTVAITYEKGGMDLRGMPSWNSV